MSKILSILAGLSLMVSLNSCSSSDDGDSKKGNGKKYNPTTTAFPSDFENSASTPEAYGERIEQIDSEIIDSAESEFGTAANLVGAVRMLQDTSGVTGMLPTMDFGAFDALEEGGNCDSFYNQLSGSLSSFSGQIEQLGGELGDMEGSFDASVLEDQYDVTELDLGDKYAFHYQLSPKTSDTDADSDAQVPNFVPVITVAGGATDTAVGMLWGTTLDLDFGEGDQAITMNQDLVTEMFADIAAKTITMGMDISMVYSTSQQDMNVTMKGLTTLDAGDTPSFTSIYDFTSSIPEQEGEGASEGSASGNFAFTIEKTDDNTFTMSIDGTMAGTSVAKTLSVTKDSSGCSVAGIE